jgi:hypothetical protein
MTRRKPDMPMVMQPAPHDLTAPTQMLPVMPTPGRETSTPAATKQQPTRADAARAAKAKLVRRDSLKKQRDAQKTKGRPSRREP